MKWKDVENWRSLNTRTEILYMKTVNCNLKTKSRGQNMVRLKIQTNKKKCETRMMAEKQCEECTKWKRTQRQRKCWSSARTTRRRNHDDAYDKDEYKEGKTKSRWRQTKSNKTDLVVVVNTRNTKRRSKQIKCEILKKTDNGWSDEDHRFKVDDLN